jgi:hypothetical protein
MKRVLIASILGLAASVASSYGQASYLFDTYLGTPTTAPAGTGVVTWTTDNSLAPVGEAGAAVLDGEGFKGDLLWQVGALTGDVGVAIPVVGGYITDAVNNSGNPVTFDPSYVSGTPIIFTIEAWQGASFATGTAKGTLTWTDPGEVLGTGFHTFSLSSPITVALAVPEPTTLALAGLGAAGMLLFRKRQ